MDRSISIIGATGRNSVAWTQAFLNAGFRVRNLVRDPSKFSPRLDLEYVAFDLDDRRTYRPALVNTGLLALVTPADPRQSERELALIEAAERSGVQRILNLSVIGADLATPISAFARWQAPVEKALEGGATPYVTLRPNAFMQNLLLQKASIEAGRFIEPSESHRSSLIDARDEGLETIWKMPDQVEHHLFRAANHERVRQIEDARTARRHDATCAW